MSNTPAEREYHTLIAALALVGVVFLLVSIRYRPPPPKAADAPEEEFSAGRARVVLTRLLGEGLPHPTGSDANHRVRRRIETELGRLGYTPSLQRTFVCSEVGTCGNVENVLARLPGRTPDTALLLAAHYDSVAAGPGASDNGAGVAAVLEIARALKRTPPLRRTVIFLLDDGEEPLLLGARAFMTEHPWAPGVGAAVNLDAGGSSGPSVLLRTSRDNLGLIRLFALTSEHPVTSSFLAAGFRQLQHNTDFTEFTRGDVQAFDFAYFANRLHYHTPLDNLQNADAGSLQHHGDQALALVRALANADLEPTAGRGDAVFFDLFAVRTVWWPTRWTQGLALIGAAGILLTLFQCLRRGMLTLAALGRGLITWVGSVMTALIGGVLLSWGLRAAGTMAGPWIATPWPAILAFAAFGVSSAELVVALVGRRAGPWGLWGGTWIGWTVLAGLVVWPAPEASYIVLVPVLAAAASGFAAVVASSAETSWARAASGLLPPVAASAVVIPATWFLYQAMGTRAFPAVTVIAALLATTVAPLQAGRRRRLFPLISAVIAIGATAMAVVTPAYSGQAPQGLNIIFHQDADKGIARWVLSGHSASIPPSLREADRFALAGQPFPWPSNPALVSSAARIDVPGPEFRILEIRDRAPGREVRALLRSPRAAPQASVMFAPAVPIEAVTVQGKPVPPIHSRFLRQSQGWRTYSCLTLPPAGVEVRITLADSGPVDVLVLDQSPGIPRQGNRLRRARPATATPIHDGDVTLMTRRIELGP